jgi:uncharacterized lipoprotein YmbA
MRPFTRFLASVPRIGRCFVAVGLLSLMLTGCFRLLEPRPGGNINYYLLDSALSADTTLTDTSATDTAGVEVGLRRPHLAAYLDASRLVTRRGSHVIRFSDTHRWGEDLDQAINRVVALNLEKEPGVQSVQVVPWQGGARFDYVVQLHVLRFEGVGPSPDPKADDDSPSPEGHTQMVVRWTVFGGDGEKTLTHGVTRHRKEEWTVTDYAALTDKLGSSLAVLARDIGGRLRSLVTQ